MTLLKKILHRWYILIGLLVFLYIIFYAIDLSEVFKILSKANPFFIGLAILLGLLTALIQPLRWNYLKSVQNIKYPLKESFLIYNVGFLFSAITPGHLGDLIKVFYLKKDGYSVGKSLVSVVLDRFADISFLVIIGYISMYFFARFFWQYIVAITIIILIGFLIFFISQRKKIFKIIAKKIFQFIVPAKYKKSWHLNYQDFMNDIKIYKLKNYLILYSFTILNWFVYYAAMFLLAKSIGLNEIPFIFLAMSITIAILATLIPISIYGLGTRDAVLLFLFSFFGVSPEKAISFSTLYLLILLVATSIGFVCWLKKPLKVKKNLINSS